jgi:tetratricopeptide (TPR) repeat protein
MSSGESAETWLEKGAEAFASMRMTEAGQAFQSAVTSDPLSAKAHLCLGVIKFFEYQNGVSMQPDLPQDYLETLRNWKPGSPPPPRPPDIRPLDPAIKSARIIEQNSTNGAKAEEHLKRTLELESRYEPAMEYLAALYFRWLDPVNHLPVRLEMARQRYTRILDTNPQHTFANYVMGVIDYERAFTIIRSETGFPRPLVDEERRRSLRAQAGPLLAESARNFVRSLELDPNNRKCDDIPDVRQTGSSVYHQDERGSRTGQRRGGCVASEGVPNHGKRCQGQRTTVAAR